MLSIDQKIFIRDQRKQGVSYKRIWELSGIRRSYVSEYSNLIQKGVVVSLAVIKANLKTGDKLRKPEETFICKACGKSFVRNPKRHSGQGTTYCSRECSFSDLKEWHRRDMAPIEHWPNMVCKVYFKECVVCGNDFTGRNKRSLTCSDDCQSVLQNKRVRIKNKAINNIKSVGKECVWCGETFSTHKNGKIYCSLKCMRKRNRADRKARGKNSFVETVSIAVLFGRDGGRCQLCGKRLKLKNKPPHLMAPTRDHIKPESLGGETSYKNMQLVCLSCNSSKGNRTVDGGEQLMLCGV